MRLLTAICLTALVVAFAVPAFAETQNIKISGDVAVSHIYQSDIDLTADDSDNQNFFVQTTGLNVQADLTDNVSSYVRILNERDWDAETTTADFDLVLDEAYVTLKEILYAPLTLKIGRQNMMLGKGFVIGNAGAVVWAGGDLNTTIQELSDRTAFDALRATLDYDPWTIDLIYVKIDEDQNALGNTDNYDDLNLYILNVGYDFTKYDAEAEAYYIVKHDRDDVATIHQSDLIQTLGLRGSFVPFDNMNVWAEGAIQFGDYVQSGRAADIEASAGNVGVDYTFTDIRWTPKLGGEMTLWTGEEVGQGGDWNAWDALYPGKFDTYISGLRNITKTTTEGVKIAGNDTGATNEVQFAIIGCLNPMTDVTLDSRLSYLFYDEVVVAGRNDELGTELDLKLTYDYTEDVQFAVAAGVLAPGEYYPENNDSTALQLISAVSVDF